jgi:hypothetical protein
MKNFLYAFLLLCINSYSQKMQFNDLSLNLPLYNGVSIAMWDQREEVTSQSKKPTFTGYTCSLSGKKYKVNTKSGKPFADDISSSVASTLNSYGCNISVVPTSFNQSQDEIIENLKSSGGSKLILIKFNEYNTDGFAPYYLYKNIQIFVFNTNGTLLKEKQFNTSQICIAGGGELYWAPTKDIVEEDISNLFFDPDIASACGIKESALVFAKDATFNEKVLAIAINRGDTGLVNRLIGQEITINDALKVAAFENNIELVKQLLEKGAKFSIEAEDIEGNITNSNGDSIKTILHVGGSIPTGASGSVKIKWDRNNKPIEITGSYAKVKINIANRQELKKHIADTQVRYKTKVFSYGNAALYYAIDNENAEMIKLFLSNGFDITKPIAISDFKDFSVLYKYLPPETEATIHNGGQIAVETNLGIISIHKDNEYTYSNFIPYSVSKVMPIEYAKEINATEIVDILSNWK